jgi:hypothetical protein
MARRNPAPFNGIGERRGLSWWYKRPILAVTHCISRAGNVDRDDRFAARRLKQRSRKSFAAMRPQTGDVTLHRNSRHVAARVSV